MSGLCYVALRGRGQRFAWCGTAGCVPTSLSAICSAVVVPRWEGLMLRHVMPKNKDNADDAMRLILVYEQPAWVDEACACMRVLVCSCVLVRVCARACARVYPAQAHADARPAPPSDQRDPLYTLGGSSE